MAIASPPRPWCLLLASALLLAPGTGRADERPAPAAKPPKPSPIAALLEPIRKKHGVPGMAGALVTRRGVIVAGATGVRRAGAEAKVTADDLWHIGSCTKSMTATLIGKLVDEGKLSWSTSLASAFPELAKTMHPDWKGVTLELLLGNRAGAPADLNRDGLWSKLWAHKGRPMEARRLLTEGVLKHEPVHPPGKKYIYSNAGFSIAGHVAETLLGKPFEELMQEKLFRPLKMTRVGFGAPGNAKLLDQPQGHLTRFKERIPIPPGPKADNPPAITPAGRVHCPIQDWARYVALHLEGAHTGAEDLLLKRATLRKLQTPLEGQTYASGWSTTDRAWGGGRVLTHSGSNTMWYAVTWLAPKREFAVLITSNMGGATAQKACDEAAWALIQWYRGNKRK